MRSIFLTLFILLIAGTIKAQSRNLSSDTILYKIEILKGVAENVKKEAAIFKSKFPTIKTGYFYKVPYLYLTVPCNQREKTDSLIKELIRDYPTLKRLECR